MLSLNDDTYDLFHDYPELRTVPSSTYYFKWMSCSLMICLIIHHGISPIVFKRYNKAYRALTRVKRMEWDSRTVSSIHATVVSLLCIYALSMDRLLWQHPIVYTSHTGLIALSVSVGYFLCDLVSMPFYWWNKQLIIFIFHHAAAAFAFYEVVTYRSCVFFGVYRLTTELSTPFINQRWFYRTIGHKPDRPRVASVTLMFALLFAITRNLMIIPFWYISYRAYHSPAYNICVQYIPGIKLMFISCCLILDILNIYWASRAYRIGFRSAKLLWSADWRADISSAKAKLRKRLLRLRLRTLSDSVEHVQEPAVMPITPDDVFMLESSSSASACSSETEYEFTNCDRECIHQYIINDAPSNLVIEREPNESTVITQRTQPCKQSDE